MYFSDCNTEKKIPTIKVLELRLQWDNFFLRSLDYDPEMSVLFGGTGGSSGNCDSDDYDILQDYIFWSSLSCVILALCCILLILLFTSTDIGYKLVTRRDSTSKMMERLENQINEINSQMKESNKNNV